MRLLRGDNIAPGQLRWTGAKHHRQADLDGLGRYALEVGDVVLAMDRPWIDSGSKSLALGRVTSPPCSSSESAACAARGTSLRTTSGRCCEAGRSWRT